MDRHEVNEKHKGNSVDFYNASKPSGPSISGDSISNNLLWFILTPLLKFLGPLLKVPLTLVSQSQIASHPVAPHDPAQKAGKHLFVHHPRPSHTILLCFLPPEPVLALEAYPKVSSSPFELQLVVRQEYRSDGSKPFEDDCKFLAWHEERRGAVEVGGGIGYDLSVQNYILISLFYRFHEAGVPGGPGWEVEELVLC